ncbi:MAG: hypothetical protein H6696_01055 [Deferribacteres bacterium]|nr:hypothetical protein [candidate division KSB1 bacterium]MCB9500496.1 hypothetical protein [Deferribacteres bacterium]
MIENKIFNMQVLKLLYQSRRRFIKIFFISAIITTLASLTLPEWYQSSAKIMPPVEEGGLSNFAAMLSDLPLKALGLGSGVSEDAILFTATLTSRTVMESVVNKFDLINRYDAKNLEEAVKTLRDHAGIVIDDEGTLTIFAEARGSWFCFFSEDARNEARSTARDMTNFLIEELDIVNKRLKSERARNSRTFVEKRYQQNVDDLAAAENDLKSFQQKYGMIALPEQTEATIKAAAELKAQIVMKEIELGVLEQSVSKTHSEYKQVQRELNEFRKKYEEFNAPLDYGNSKGEKIEVFVPLEDAPEVGLMYARKFREVFIQEKILEFLLPQYEQAKIKEAQDTPTVQVLDDASFPIKKHRPKRSILIAFFTFLACLGGFFYIIYKPAMQKFIAEIKSEER